MFLLFTWIACTQIAQARSDLFPNLSQEHFHAWQKLLHYQPRVLGGFKSANDSPAFFLSPSGKSDPEAEWNTTWNAFHTPLIPEQDPNTHALCRFPARAAWMQKNLSEHWRAPPVRCEKFLEFERMHSVKSASLIFSTHYLNNPASAFGHTFLRLERPPIHPGTPRSALLDLGINYAANVPQGENALVYSVKGIIGGYPGQFMALPYYYKVREYNDSESRDLWEYRLNLKTENLKQLVRHLWELGPTYFDYFYFDENCSYHILGLLDAADPTLKLQEKLFPVVIPTDTVHVVINTPGLVESIHYEPSIAVQLNTRFHSLKPKQQNEFLSLLSKIYSNEDLPTQDPEVLDALNDWLDWKHYRRLIAEDPETVRMKNALRKKRADLGGASAELKIEAPEKTAPHLGHGSKRLGLMGGRDTQNKLNLAELRFRFALHDLMDSPDGFSRHAQIEMGAFRVRFMDSESIQTKIQWQEVNLIRILSLSPWNAYHKPVSWTLDVGGQRITDRQCFQCGDWGARGGTGFTFEPFQNFKNPALLTIAPFLEVGIGIQNNRTPAIHFMPTLRMYSSPFLNSSLSRLRLGLITRATKTWPRPDRFLLEARPQIQWNISQNWALSAESRISAPIKEYLFGFYSYF